MSTITIYVTHDGKEVSLNPPTDMGSNLLEVLNASAHPIAGTCGGLGTCSSCHVYINSDNQLVTMGMIEDMMLDDVEEKRKENSRLSCQLHITPKLDNLKISIP
jgi:2Fe-2S ferredoxin